MNLDNYVDVATRRRIAAELFPELRIVEGRPEVVTVGGDTLIAVTVTVYRTPDDPIPTSATAWEPYPGKSSFTRGSEMMNASTSALGRALGFLGIGIGKSIATADEVATRTADRAEPVKAPARPAQPRTASQGTDRPKLATQPQLAKMNALLMELGVIARPDKLAKVAELAGREVNSSTDLTTAEASRIVEALTLEATNKRAADDLAAMIPQEAPSES